jgi:hypothetical protein
VECEVLGAIARAFGLEWPLPASAIQFLDAADNTLLATEARDLMAPAPQPWSCGAEPLREVIHPWSWDHAEWRFLERWRELRAV